MLRQTTQKQNDAKIAIEKLVSEFPNLSINKVSAADQISSSLTRNILKQDLQMKPYKIPVHQQLKPPDYKKKWWILPNGFSSYLKNRPS